HALDLRHAHASVRRLARVLGVRAGAAARRMDGADLHRISSHARRLQLRRGPPTPAVERHADRVRAGVVRASLRGVDFADAVGPLQVERGVNRKDARFSDRWNDPHARQSRLDRRKVPLRQRTPARGLLHGPAATVRRDDHDVLHRAAGRLGGRSDGRVVRDFYEKGGLRMSAVECRMQNAECRIEKPTGTTFFILRSAFCVLHSLFLAIACRQAPAEKTDTREPIAVQYVGVPELLVHKWAKDDSPVITKFLNGEGVPILSRRGDWVEVRTVSGSGFAHAADLTNGAEAKIEEANP